MGRSCTVCTHPDRATIDETLVVGQRSYGALATDYGLTRASLSRHREAHVSEALKAVVVERAKDGPRSALERLEALLERVERVLTTAEEAGQATTALAAAREIRSGLEMVARITGELNERPQVVFAVLQSQEWQQLRGVLLEALRPYPEAGQAVAAALASVPELGS